MEDIDKDGIDVGDISDDERNSGNDEGNNENMGNEKNDTQNEDVDPHKHAFQRKPRKRTSIIWNDFEEVVDTDGSKKVSLLEENIKPRTDLPPLLVHLREQRPEKLHYIGVSFGLTLDLFRFWRKHKFAPFYIGQIPSTVTGEHTCMVLKTLNNDDIEATGSDQWGFFGPFYQDFRQRFARLLGCSFRAMEYKLAMRSESESSFSSLFRILGDAIGASKKFKENPNFQISHRKTLEIVNGASEPFDPIRTLSSAEAMGWNDLSCIDCWLMKS
ncbi:hypothetical protein F0562_035724 [Nyssa sinensis]|uniref:N-acetyltransferase domain-containing protein n=1 Tax=Nyssa sinensis TaxID=561372 RepID=A0A5J5ADQ4_9ASTE|nr:hypothetical protein F0562_035724 [Nyssa sinensis]